MIGAGAIRRPVLHQRSTRGCPDADPLPDIVGRLARLEEAHFSYDDLLLDFASRRHLNPVKGSPVVGRGATDPAQEADEIVQVGNESLKSSEDLQFTRTYIRTYLCVLH